MPNDTNNDLEHLRLLRIFHYVVGGMIIVFSSILIFHTILGIVIYLKPELLPRPPQGQPGPEFPREFGLLISIFAGGGMLLGWTLGILTIVSGRMLGQLRHRTFSIVIAGIQCICCVMFPFTTALGICTLIVLMRDSVQQLYDHQSVV